MAAPPVPVAAGATRVLVGSPRVGVAGTVRPDGISGLNGILTILGL